MKKIVTHSIILFLGLTAQALASTPFSLCIGFLPSGPQYTLHLDHLQVDVRTQSALGDIEHCPRQLFLQSVSSGDLIIYSLSGAQETKCVYASVRADSSLPRLSCNLSSR